MTTRIETQYDYQTRQVHVSYGTQLRRLFHSSSVKIAEILDEYTFSKLCDEMDESGPRSLASGAILLSQLSKNNALSADVDEFNWALTLVARMILQLADSGAPMGDLPTALVVLGFIAPVGIAGDRAACSLRFPQQAPHLAGSMERLRRNSDRRKRQAWRRPDRVDSKQPVAGIAECSLQRSGIPHAVDAAGERLTLVSLRFTGVAQRERCEMRRPDRDVISSVGKPNGKQHGTDF